jgi:hypothetical protein
MTIELEKFLVSEVVDIGFPDMLEIIPDEMFTILGKEWIVFLRDFCKPVNLTCFRERSCVDFFDECRLFFYFFLFSISSPDTIKSQ